MNKIFAYFCFLFLVGCVTQQPTPTAFTDIKTSVRVAQQANESTQEVCDTGEFEQKPAILANTGIIRTELKSIDRAAERQNTQVQSTQKQLDKLRDRRYQGVSFLCLVGVGIGAFLIITGAAKIGVATIVGCIATLGSIFVINAISGYLWLIGGVIAFALIGAILYFVYVLLIKNKAIEQLVASVQISKDATDKSFIRRELDVIQSDTTKDIVTRIKR